jgi:hypothetical protein
MLKEIEQIKMRKDIQILRDKYNIRLLNLAKHIGLKPTNLRNFLDGRILVDRNHEIVKQGLLDVMEELKNAEQYRGFDEG